MKFITITAVEWVDGERREFTNVINLEFLIRVESRPAVKYADGRIMRAPSKHVYLVGDIRGCDDSSSWSNYLVVEDELSMTRLTDAIIRSEDI